VGQARSWGRSPDGTDDDYELFEWEFRTKAGGEIEFVPPASGGLSPLDTSELSVPGGSGGHGGHNRSRSMGVVPSAVMKGLPSVSENSSIPENSTDPEPPARFEPGSIVFHVDSYGNRGTRSLATSGPQPGRPASLSSDSGRVGSDSGSNSPASQKSPTAASRLSGLFGGSSRERSGGSRRSSLGKDNSTSSSSSSTSS